MDEKYLVLDRRIRKDLEILEGLWAELADVEPASVESDKKELVFLAYNLHGLYSAAENIFRNISDAFGNQLGDQTGWHAELLDRMRLDLTPLRPAVIDDAAFDQLDELRRFRHLFRAAYGIKLDAERVRLVLRKALTLRERLPGQVRSFLAFLENLDS